MFWISHADKSVTSPDSAADTSQQFALNCDVLTALRYFIEKVKRTIGVGKGYIGATHRDY